MIYVPPLIGHRAVLPAACGLKGLYLKQFGLPDVRVHLTAAHLMRIFVPLRCKHVLDIGCGNGCVTLLMGAQNLESSVVGWDRDPASIEFASHLAAQNGSHNVRFETVDVERDGLSGVYDCITALAVLQFVRDVPALMNHLATLLTPGGHLILQVPLAHGTARLLRLPTLASRMPDFHEARGGFSELECRQLLDTSRLALVEARSAIKGPTILAKELFYLARSLGNWAQVVLTPLLNWVTVFDPWYPGRGNGLFLVARKPV